MNRGARRVVLAVVFGAMASGLAACGDDDGGGNGGQSGAKPSDVVTIEMSDFAYSVSGPLIAGGTLRIRNVGQEFHMVGIGRLKPGKTLADLTRVLQEASGPPGGGEAGAPSTTAASATTVTTRAGATTSTTAGGASTSAPGGQGGGGGGPDQDPTADIIDDVGFPGNFMSPGESVEVRVPNLTPGAYALVCFIPSEGDPAPHFAKGMVNQLEVVSGTAPAEPTADATYRVAPGQPVQGPTTLTAGKHTLRIEAAAGSGQLEPTLVRLNSGATFTQLDEAFTRLFEGQDPPPKGAAKQAPGQVVFGGFDLRDVTSFTLTVDLKAGNYLIVAEDTDSDNRPSPPRELISIRVT